MAEEKRSTINVRLGESLLQAIRMEAAKNANSMNAEIVQRLEASLKKGSLLTDAIENYRDSFSPENDDERGLIRIWRSMLPKEREALRAFVSILIDLQVE